MHETAKIVALKDFTSRVTKGQFNRLMVRVIEFTLTSFNLVEFNVIFVPVILRNDRFGDKL